MHQPGEHETEPASSAASLPRLLLLGAVLAGGLALAHGTGLAERVTLDAVRATVREAGPAGPLVFVLVFCLGELAHVPGLVFVGAALLVWGPLPGAALAFAGALASVSTTFLFVRALGGQPAGALRGAWARRALAQLDRRPVLTVALLRTLLVLSPPLNYALALTSLRFRDHLLGSALGLVPPIGAATLASGWLVERLS
jgi:uncharacterized membrane protein YdjX (TVP38/TMEM64 family)